MNQAHLRLASHEILRTPSFIKNDLVLIEKCTGENKVLTNAWFQDMKSKFDSCDISILLQSHRQAYYAFDRTMFSPVLT